MCVGGGGFNGDIWRDSAESGKPEPLNPAKSPFLKEAAFSTPAEEDGFPL